MEEIIHIAFGIHDNTGEYSRHLGAAIASILDHTDAQVEIHLLHDYTLSNENRSGFLALVNKFGQSILFHNVALELNTLKSNTLKSNTVGTLFRLMLPQIIKDVDKIIYLDCDIICNMDISSIWKVDIKEYAVAAVKDSDTYLQLAATYEFYQYIDILNEKYFNAGLVVLNLLKIRQNYNLYDDCMGFLYKNPKAPCLDQDALNYLFQNDCLLLTSNYNLIADDAYTEDNIEYFSEESWKGICWHFAGPEKPWFSKKYPVFLLYWRYLAMTPWANTTDKLLKWMYLIEGDSLDNLMLTQRVGNRKSFVKNFFVRLYREVKKKYL